jgi:hypothetical protein
MQVMRDAKVRCKKRDRNAGLYSCGPQAYRVVKPLMPSLLRRTGPGEAKATVRFQSKLGSSEARRKR